MAKKPPVRLEPLPHPVARGDVSVVRQDLAPKVGLMLDLRRASFWIQFFALPD